MASTPQNSRQDIDSEPQSVPLVSHAASQRHETPRHVRKVLRVRRRLAEGVDHPSSRHRFSPHAFDVHLPFGDDAGGHIEDKGCGGSGRQPNRKRVGRQASGYAAIRHHPLATSTVVDSDYPYHASFGHKSRVGAQVTHMVAVECSDGADTTPLCLVDPEYRSLVRQSVAKTPVTVDERCRGGLTLAGENGAGSDQALAMGVYVDGDLDNAVG